MYRLAWCGFGADHLPRPWEHSAAWAGRHPPFFIDRYEVTNKQFKEFIDAGGYQKREYWKNKFARDGRALSFEEAMAELRDATGRPGPATWEAGRYPDGQENFPVAGVNWYEAAAYAEFAGKACRLFITGIWWQAKCQPVHHSAQQFWDGWTGARREIPRRYVGRRL